MVRPLVPDDGRQVGLLTEEIFRELNSSPVMSVEDHIRLFQTPWLARGAGLVLECGALFCGYGYARASTWQGADCVHTAIALRRGFRTSGAHDALTVPLLELAEEVGARYGIRRALVYLRGVDTIHPPIIRDMGFAPCSTSMIGFRHDLSSVPLRSLPPDIEMRTGRLPQDLDVVAELSERAFDNTEVQGQPSHRQRFELEMMKPGFDAEQLLIAEAGGEPVAYAFVEQAASEDDTVYELSEIGVAPELRGRGIGGALVSRVLNWIRARGARTALVAAFNTNPAATLYWRMGFRPDPLRSFCFFTRPVQSTRSPAVSNLLDSGPTTN